MKIKRFIIFAALSLIMFCAGCGGGGGNVMPEEKTGMLFDDKEGTYNYAPSVLQLSDTERYIYYCGSPGDRRIVDLIQCRKGTKNTKTGQWEYGEVKTLLQPTMLTWDSSHTCDPSAVAGEFEYDGEKYGYLLTYLGCATANNQENEMGMAVAKAPDGPFIKCNKINPIIKFERDKENDSAFQWGYGQASMISIDKKGKVLMFYTEGNPRETYTHVSRWDFSNLNDPKCEFDVRMKTDGLITPYGGADFMNSADFMYDEANKRIYAVSPVHTPVLPDNPTGISEQTRVTYIDEPDATQIGDGFTVESEQRWKTLYTISEKVTGFDYQHNCGFVRDQFGYITESDTVEIIYTRGIKNADDPFLTVWSYRMYNYRYKLTEK